MDATKTQPVIRVRLKHTSTMKEGWRLDETTVEYTAGSDGIIDWDRIESVSRASFEVGTREAEKRNAGQS